MMFLGIEARSSLRTPVHSSTQLALPAKVSVWIDPDMAFFPGNMEILFFLESSYLFGRHIHDPGPFGSVLFLSVAIKVAAQQGRQLAAELAPGQHFVAAGGTGLVETGLVYVQPVGDSWDCTGRFTELGHCCLDFDLRHCQVNDDVSGRPGVAQLNRLCHIACVSP